MTREWIEQKIKEAHKNAVYQNKNIDELLMWIILDLGKAFEAHKYGRFADWNNFEWQLSKSGHTTEESFENNIKDTSEDKIADAIIGLFDLCGYLGIEPSSVNWDYFYPSPNIATSLLAITGKVVDFLEYYRLNDLDIDDVFSEIIGFTNGLNIPIEKHIEAKMAYNKTRQAKHGKTY
jgi:hypothetical protein